MSLTIGELAQRLRVTPRTLRHYDQLGLLAPEHVDPRSGYRMYGHAQLLRGMRIEQLKATGLSLSAIREVLQDGDATEALCERRRQIEGLVAEQTAQLRAIDALLASTVDLGLPEIVDVPEDDVVTTRVSCAGDGLNRAIRRAIQRLGRDTRRHSGVRCRSFSASFPLHVGDGPMDVDVIGHLDEPTEHSTTQPARTQLKVVLVGDIGLLPLAYDVVIAAVQERDLQPCGTAVEHYLDLAAVGRTEVAIPIRSLHP